MGAFAAFAGFSTIGNLISGYNRPERETLREPTTFTTWKNPVRVSIAPGLGAADFSDHYRSGIQRLQLRRGPPSV